MSRRLRFTPERGSLVHLTWRTLQGRYLLTPRPELNEIIVGALARAQELYPVGICALAFASNHYHLLLLVEDVQRMASFMNHFQSNLAREAGRLFGWPEKFWARRYQAIPVSGEEAAQVERLRYLLAHGCKEGLVERLSDWPGVHAAQALVEGKPLEGTWFDRTREAAARRRNEAFESMKYATRYTLTLVPLPCWEHLSPEKYRERVARLVQEIEAEAAARREAEATPARGPKEIRAQQRHERPKRLKKGPAPLFHAATKRVRKELSEAYAHFVAAFREAAELLKAGQREVCFPPGSFPPALPFVPG